VELTRALAVYAPGNPKVTLLQTQIADLQAKIGATPPEPGKTESGQSTDGNTDASAPMTPLDIQTTQIDSQILQRNQESDDISKQLAALKDSIDRSSAVAVQLEALNRDYSNIQAQYDTATDRLSKASTGERIAALSKGQRIGVLDAATVPDTPARPNRVKIIALGAALGLALGFGLVVLLELLNTSVRRPVDLERHLNITPIGTIPYMRTPGEILRLRLTIAILILAIVVALPAGIYAIDRYYMPVDLILAKIITKLGL
jgi:uncharacterized protein involved in exopolysaccharide biosynthesis